MLLDDPVRVFAMRAEDCDQIGCVDPNDSLFGRCFSLRSSFCFFAVAASRWLYANCLRRDAEHIGFAVGRRTASIWK